MPETPRAIWSGILSFGLVSIPVELHSVVRPARTSLRMLGPDGGPLQRRYRCPAHDRLLEPEEIVRGHEEEDGSFLVVEDEELQALEPKRSREIELQRFVPRDQISPMHLVRPYLLLPAGENTKAYRLLAQTMDEAGRVGIATFVMRGHAYVIAISAHEGLLRGETLRYASELRGPEDVGLPPAPRRSDAARTRAFVEAIEAEPVVELEALLGGDEEADRVAALAREKQARGEVVEVDQDARPDGEDEEAGVVDLMQLLKERLLGGTEGAAGDGAGPAQVARRRPARAALEDKSRQELYREAQALELPGRSKMSKSELVEALTARR